MCIFLTVPRLKYTKMLLFPSIPLGVGKVRWAAWVILGVKACEVFLCFLAIIFLGCIVF